MEGLKNYREKIKGIEKLVNKMESGQLSIHELSELETLTRELHERSIILKYKAFEGAGSTEKVSVPVAKEELVVEDTVIEPIAEVKKDVIPAKEEAPVLEFSIFDETVDDTDAQHQDLSFVDEDVEDDEEEEVIEEPKKVEKPVELEKVVEEKKPAAAEPKPDPKPDPKPEPKIEAKAELIVEEPIAVVREKGSSFLDRLSILDNSISSQLAGRKIDTLIGAFGINERMVYINELFDGSGEAFSDAIKALDGQSNLDAASTKVEELAFKNSWNPEEEVVLEFLAIIKRRYA